MMNSILLMEFTFLYVIDILYDVIDILYDVIDILYDVIKILLPLVMGFILWPDACQFRGRCRYWWNVVPVNITKLSCKMAAHITWRFM